MFLNAPVQLPGLTGDNANGGMKRDRTYEHEDQPLLVTIHHQIFAIFSANIGISGSQLTDSGLSKISGSRLGR